MRHFLYMFEKMSLGRSFTKTNTRSLKMDVAQIKTKERKNMLFDEEIKRQRENVGRIEKIKVNYIGMPEAATLVMNKGVSTPYNCAQHFSETHLNHYALALVDEKFLWDIHRPLEKDCKLRLLHFMDADPHHLNKAFWRSCSVILGAVIQNLFKEGISVFLHSFPSPNVRSGSFVYDVKLDLNDWQPTKDELRVMSAEMVSFCQRKLRFERLEVSVDLALQMFEDNKYKTEQIPHIASQISEDNKMVIYRVGDHIDISRGPMIGDTSFVGRCTIASVHKFETEQGMLYRFQGVALPRGIMLNHFAYGILEERARKMNKGRLPVMLSKVSEIFHPAAEMHY